MPPVLTSSLRQCPRAEGGVPPHPGARVRQASLDQRQRVVDVLHGSPSDRRDGWGDVWMEGGVTKESQTLPTSKSMMYFVVFGVGYRGHTRFSRAKQANKERIKQFTGQREGGLRGRGGTEGRHTLTVRWTRRLRRSTRPPWSVRRLGASPARNAGRWEGRHRKTPRRTARSRVPRRRHFGCGSHQIRSGQVRL